MNKETLVGKLGASFSSNGKRYMIIMFTERVRYKSRVLYRFEVLYDNEYSGGYMKDMVVDLPVSVAKEMHRDYNIHINKLLTGV